MRVPGIVTVLLFFALTAGCTTQPANPAVSVVALDIGDIPSTQVGDFDIYTESFLIANPTNLTFSNLRVDITLSPVATYCHGSTQSFTYPRFDPLEKKTERVSIAEFGDLGCMYNYTYRVSSGGS